MLKLIVNADDMGISTARDKGILESYTRGIVTSVSLLANGSSFSTAVPHLIEHYIPTGVHLNLSEGKPLGGPIEGLTTSSGCFPGKYPLRSILQNQVASKEKIYQELSLQVERCINAGLSPDHLDTHQHFCLFPEMHDLIIEVAEKYGVKALRNPLPSDPPSATRMQKGLAEEVSLYQHLAPETASRIESSGMHSPQGILGMSLLNQLTEHTLGDLLQSGLNGVLELMVHPGYPDFTDSFSGNERLKEMKALISPRVISLVQDLGIELISFGDLLCAS